MHDNALLAFRTYCKPWVTGKVLEVGPEAFPSVVRQQCPDVAQWDTLNITNDSRLTFPGVAPYDYPIPPDSYDTVIALNVLEHVPEIWRWLKQLALITKPGGSVLTVNPVNWPYHPDPVDCWRVYPDGMAALYQQAGLTVVVSDLFSQGEPKGVIDCFTVGVK